MIVAYAALFGLAFGSFVNAAIDRIPRGLSLTGRSHCDGCSRALRAWELIPILSYAMLRGRCGSCSNAIGLRTPLIEISCAVWCAAAFAALSTPAAVAVSVAFVAVVLTVGVAIEKRGLKS